MDSYEDILRRTAHRYAYGNLGDNAIPYLDTVVTAYDVYRGEVPGVPKEQIISRLDRLARYAFPDDRRSLEWIEISRYLLEKNYH